MPIGLDRQIGADPGQRTVGGGNGLVTTHKVALVGFDKAHNGCFGERHFVVELRGAREHFFHSQAVHREAAIVGNAMGLSGLPQRLINRQHGFARAVELPAHLARVGHAECPHSVAGNGDLFAPQPGEIGDFQRLRDMGCQCGLGLRSLQRHGEPVIRQVADRDLRITLVTRQMIQQPLLEKGGAGQVVAVVGEFHDGHFHLDAPTLIEHVGEANAADVAGQGIGDEATQERLGVGP